MKPIIIIQARTGSTRLPQKMVMPFYNGKCVLEILVERLKTALPDMEVDDIVVATTTNSHDEQIAQLCDKIDVKCYRGSEQDVLQRFIKTAKHYGADKIIRICADNVFLDISALATLASYLNTNGDNYDYVSFKKTDETPSILTHYGFFSEGVSLSALERVSSYTDDPKFHEHVTNYLYNAQDIFKVKLFPVEDAVPGIESHNSLRLTLDTQDDFDVQRIIYSYFMDNNLAITPKNIIEYLDKLNPALYTKMAETIKANSK